jgi:hypothetical protein
MTNKPRRGLYLGCIQEIVDYMGEAQTCVSPKTKEDKEGVPRCLLVLSALLLIPMTHDW